MNAAVKSTAGSEQGEGDDFEVCWQQSKEEVSEGGGKPIPGHPRPIPAHLKIISLPLLRASCAFDCCILLIPPDLAQNLRFRAWRSFKTTNMGKQISGAESVNPMFAEECGDICAVPEEEIEPTGMNGFNCLAHINEPAFLLPPQDVVLRQVSMDKMADLVKLHHHFHNLIVSIFQLLFRHSLNSFF